MQHRQANDPGCFAVRAATIALALGTVLAAGCGEQAGTDYRGEPLLKMRGEAVVAALTGGQPVEPAICFRRPGNEPLDPSGLPQEVLDVLALSDPTAPGKLSGSHAEVDIVSVESLGQFPSQFEVAVYVPPPDAALGRKITSVEGEPTKAVGEVCAVLPGVGEHAYEVIAGGVSGCDEIQCRGDLLLFARDSSRAYARAYACPVEAFGDPDQCPVSAAGDETLLYETFAEGVVGSASDLEVVYLAEAAPAGSYTAWEYGASAGLSAGYHVFVKPAPGEGACLAEVYNDSQIFADIEAAYRERIVAEVGEGYVFMFPYAVLFDGDEVDAHQLPDDVITGGNRMIADQLMVRCPMPNVAELDTANEEMSLTIDVFEESFTDWPNREPLEVPGFP